VYDGIPHQVKQRAGDRGITAENMESHSIPISTKIRLMKALGWPVATYGCESWTLRKNEETRLDAFEMKGLRKTLRVSWTAKKKMSGFLKMTSLINFLHLLRSIASALFRVPLA